MSTFAVLRDSLRLGGVAILFLMFAFPAAAGEIYSWRTEDGGFAFTDDPKAVPARYRSQAATRETAGLGDYERLTEPEPGAMADYSRRLDDRLDHLRRLNRDLDAAYAAARTRAPQLESLSVESGDFNIGVPLDDAGDGPVVIENIRYLHEGEMATRHNVVVRRGGETLAVIKGRPLATQINQAPDGAELLE